VPQGHGVSKYNTNISIVKRVEFAGDRIAYTTSILRGRRCDIVLNVRKPTEDKILDMKGSFYKELECAFDRFPKYHLKILLGGVNSKVGRKDIFKQTAGNESLHKISNGNGVGVLNFATG
jgi:hypothetical protein